MIYFLSLQLTYKNSILHYKTVKITINIPNFVEVISNVIVYQHNLSDLAIVMEVFSNIVVCHHNLLCLVVINSYAFYPLKICHCYAIF